MDRVHAHLGLHVQRLLARLPQRSQLRQAAQERELGGQPAPGAPAPGGGAAESLGARPGAAPGRYGFCTGAEVGLNQ